MPSGPLRADSRRTVTLESSSWSVIVPLPLDGAGRTRTYAARLEAAASGRGVRLTTERLRDASTQLSAGRCGVDGGIVS